MLTRIRQWLAPPVFPDEERTQAAELLNLLFLAFIAGMLLDALLLYVLAPETVPTLWMNGLATVVAWILREVMRRGHVRFVAVIFCVLLYPLLVYYLAISGGLASPAFGFLFVGVPIGLILFGTQGAILLGVFAILTVASLYVGSYYGLLVSSEGPPTLARLFATNTVLFILLTSLVAIGGRSIRDAINRARQGEKLLADRNRELQRQIAERAQIEDQLRRRDIILEAVSTASSSFLKAANWQQEIGHVLGILGTAAAADRAAIHQGFADPQGMIQVNLNLEWNAPGIPPVVDNPVLHNLDVEGSGYGPIFERLRQKLPAVYHIRTISPDIATIARTAGIRSSLHLPIFVHDKLWGSLHFSTVREEGEWSKPELEALQIAADMLGAVVERKEAEDVLQEYTTRLTMLHQIDRAALVAETPQEIAGVVMHCLYQAIPYRRALVELLDQETGEWVLLAACSSGDSIDDPDAYTLLDPVWIERLRQDQPYALMDLRILPDIPPAFQFLRDEGLSGLAAMPLIAHGTLLGYLCLLAQDNDTFTPTRLEIAQEIASQFAIAVQQIHLFEVEHNQRTLAEALRDSAAAMSSTLDLDDVLKRILVNAVRVVPHDAANIMLIENGTARVVCSRGWDERGLGDWIAGVRYSVDEMPKWDEFFTGPHPRSLLIPDVQADPEWISYEGSKWVRSAAGVPIVIGGQLKGVLNLDSATPGYFTQNHLNRLQTFANEAAIAIHNAQLFQAEQRRRQIAETLVHAAAVLTSTLKLNQVLDLILQGLHDVIDYDSASIQQLKDDELRIIACLGFMEPDAVIGLRFPLEPKFPNWRVIIEKAPLAFENIAQEYPHFQQESRRYASGHVTSWLGLPLLSRDQVIGMITLDWLSPRRFPAEEIELAMAFANQAAVALENAQLYEQTQHHAAEMEQRVKDRTAELEAANEELRVVSRLKDEFVSNVSHELRTPITNLNLRYYLINKQPDQLSVHLPVAQRETSRLARIIDDLLTLSRMDQERTPFTLVAMDLNPLVRQFVLDRIPQAESLGLLLRVDCVPQPLPVQADAGLLEQVLSVLLTNALNYTPWGGQVTISTLVRPCGNRCQAGFKVQDTGPGVRKEEQPRLFTRFFRGAAGYESRVSGTGLGLAIAKEIVTRHHGEIGVESEGVPGLGSAFSVWLPMSDLTPGESSAS